VAFCPSLSSSFARERLWELSQIIDDRKNCEGGSSSRSVLREALKYLQ